MSPAPPFFSRSRIVGYLSLFAFLALVLIGNAWIVDDAYITFRSVDNFVNGRGLTWNPDERVQVYTHPLWMLVVSLAYRVTGEFFFTVLGLSILLTLAAVLVVWRAATDRFREAPWKATLLVLALLSSKAVIDFASSGLENCLSYLIAALFFAGYLSPGPSEGGDEMRRFRRSLFLASLAFVNRMDTILLYLPALFHDLWRFPSSRGRFRLRAWGIAASPALLWVLFSLFYYGTPFPNTAYAKDFSTGFPLDWKLRRGLEYFGNSLSWDTCSYLMLGICAWLSYRLRKPRSGMVLTGIGLYLMYVLFDGASATHMSGRFFAVPFFVAIQLLVTLAPDRRFGVAVGVPLALFILYSPISAPKFGTPFYRPYVQEDNFIDTKSCVAEQGAAFVNWRPGRPMPDHGWYHEGERLRASPPRVHLGGAFGGEAIGYFGFAAGPGVHVIDRVALSDPLLARLPAVRPESFSKWKSGHFHRAIPDGYAESIEAGRNVIRNLNLRAYYEAIRIITRGPLFSADRLMTIVNMNLGRYDHLIPLYLSALRARGGPAGMEALPPAEGYGPKPGGADPSPRGEGDPP